MHSGGGDATARPGYPDREAYMADIAVIYREEIADLGRLGCTYLQLDDVALPVICDPENWERVKARGEDPDRNIDLYIDTINAAVRDRPAGMSVCVHMCRGNRGDGMASGGYEPIAERMFNRLDVDGFLLEYDTPRAGDFSPLRFVPKGKTVALGLVSTKLTELETVDALKARIEEAARYVDIDQLCLCPQCGFASSFFIARFTEADEERKLARLVEAADAIWG
jgi:5-methyltetrahydropteroyltriglutamate--homocysteine methyltransferase